MTAVVIGVPGIAFGAVFGLFVVAFVVLVVLTLRWAVVRDRQRRRAWLARRAAEPTPAAGDQPGPDDPPPVQRPAPPTPEQPPATTSGPSPHDSSRRRPGPGRTR